MTLPLFQLTRYQRTALAELRLYLQKCVELGSADAAFYARTGRPFVAAPSLPGLPYVCLRVPTGGGKTIMAAHSVAVAADSFLRCENPTVLWLVPSDAIREQTLSTLSNREHPNRRALADRFGENVRILTIQDALYAKRADYDGGAVILVATLQAFRVEKTEGRKVYEANGELMDHFTGLSSAQKAGLEAGPAGDPLPSLANVLRMRRPMVIVDEAHNARTELSFETLERLSPSLIVEFTATPVTPKEHSPDKGRFASNVLHSVSAAELKAEAMIKLPVVLRGRPDPRDTIADAIAWLDELSATARKEEAESGEFVRPVMLVQAEARSKDKPTLHADEVKRMLMDDYRVPEEHIVIATGDSRGLDGVDLFHRDCRVRFIITQQALKEGWDCSFAYVLCSVAEQKSARAVEQLLGRVLRMPNAKRKKNENLNRAFAFATTTSFQEAANSLKDGLVANGFEKVDADSLVRAVAPVFPAMEAGGVAYVCEVEVPFNFNFDRHEATISTLTGGRVGFDRERGMINARGALTDYDRRSLLLAMPGAERLVEAIVRKSRGAHLRPDEQEQASLRFAVPRLAVRTSKGLELFDRGHFLDIPWRLENEDADAVTAHFAPPKDARDEAHMDIDGRGSVNIDFIAALHDQLAFNLQERGWTRNALVNWLDRRLPHAARMDVTRVSSTLFISRALDTLSQRYGLPLDALARMKFRISDALEKVIAQHRDRRQTEAYQHALFAQNSLCFETSSEVELVFDETGYAYRYPYEGAVVFRKHANRVVGDLDRKGDEHDCAVYLERMPEVKAGIRNTAQQKNSFWLQTSTDKFYPDFLALLQDGRYLVVEYKGEHLSSAVDAREKRLVGELWADRSNGKCRFLMIGNREFNRIDAAIQQVQMG